jgi:hypothetical protein
MKKCRKCGANIPVSIVIEGRKRNLNNRKFCLACSPFGYHNTSKLCHRKAAGSKTRICPDCFKEHDQKGNRCFVCYFHRRKQQVLAKVTGLIGKSCWFCGYNKTWRNLCFHHLDPQEKRFELTTRELMLKWDRILTEMKKCVLVCCNCHGEIHEQLISQENVESVWKTHWT